MLIVYPNYGISNVIENLSSVVVQFLAVFAFVPLYLPSSEFLSSLQTKFFRKWINKNRFFVDLWFEAGAHIFSCAFSLRETFFIILMFKTCISSSPKISVFRKRCANSSYGINIVRCSLWRSVEVRRFATQKVPVFVCVQSKILVA